MVGNGRTGIERCRHLRGLDATMRRFAGKHAGVQHARTRSARWFCLVTCENVHVRSDEMMLCPTIRR